MHRFQGSNENELPFASAWKNDMLTIARNRKEQLKKVEILAIELARANTHLHYFRELYQAYRAPLKFQDFWDYTLTAHFCLGLLQICRVYDTHKEGINLLLLLESVDKNGLKGEERERFDEYLGHFRKGTKNTVVSKYRNWRNDIIAHYNLKIAVSGRDKFANEHSLNLLEAQQLINLGFEVLEWFSHIHGHDIKCQRFPDGKDGHEYLLECLRAKDGE